MKKIVVAIIGLLFISSQTFAQNVGIGTTTPDTSALLELKSTTKGFLPPRMTAAQKGLIPVPKAGLIIYQSDGTKGLYLYNGTAWVAVSGSSSTTSSGWALTGNAGTSATTNFIGTTDNKPLKFRVNKIPSGGLDAVNANAAFGVHALDSNTTGTLNNAIGYNSLHNNGGGHDNNAMGVAALYNNKGGSNNSAMGTSALTGSNGDDNVALGAYSLQYNTVGNGNVAVGNYALLNNTSGNNNTIIGYKSDVFSGDATNATAIGAQAFAACQNCMVLGSVKGINQATATVNVGIGITTPLSLLHLKQTSETYPVNGGGLRLERATTTDQWEIGVDYGNDFNFVFNGVAKGYINDVTGAYTAVSDLRMKKDIALVGPVTALLMQLQPKKYHYKDNQENAPLSYGFIAQDVEKLFPDFVTTKGPDGMKAIAYQNFNVVAIKAIQEQQLIIENQNKRISELEAKIERVLKSMAK